MLNIYIDDNNGFKLNNTIHQREKLSQNIDIINNFTRNKNNTDSKYNTQNNKNNNIIIKKSNIVKYKKIYNINQNNKQINLNDKNYYTKFKTDISKHSHYPTNPNLDKKINEIKSNVKAIKIKNNNIMNIRNITNINNNLQNNINYKKFTKKPIHLRNIMNINSNINSNIISNKNVDYTIKNSENINSDNKRKNIIINNLYIKSYYNNVNDQNYSTVNNNSQRVQENIYRTNNILPNSNNKHSRYKTLAIRENLKINH